MTDPAPGGRRGSDDLDDHVPPRPIRAFPDLSTRLLSALVLTTIALIDFWQGGIWVTALVALVTALMIWEFRRMLVPDLKLSDPTLWAMIGLGAASILATGMVSLTAGAAVLLVGLGPLAFLSVRRRGWMLFGLVYIVFAMAILVELRRDPAQGFNQVLWLVSVVIAADAGAYFAGRLIGGPKLWPAVSPNKTWAGALGGLALALSVGAGFKGSGAIALPWLIALSGLLAVASQLGDLLESWLKRKVGVKDSSRLIPGHGGLLDRFDGLLGALWAFGLLSLTGLLAV